MLLQPVLPEKLFFSRLKISVGIFPVAVSEASTGCRNHAPFMENVSAIGAAKDRAVESFLSPGMELIDESFLLVAELQEVHIITPAARNIFFIIHNFYSYLFLLG